MRTLIEAELLVRRVARLWLGYLPRLGAWFLVGWMARVVATHISTMLGGEHRVWATLVFVLGVSAQVLTMIAMIHELKPALLVPRTIGRGEAGPITDNVVPTTVLHRERLVDTMLFTIGPFLAVYAVWNVIDQWVADLFIWNIAVNPLGREDGSWSVSVAPDQFKLYAGIGLAALAARTVYGWATRNSRSRLVQLPLVFLEALWAFCLFFVTLIGLGWLELKMAGWAIYRDGYRAWMGFLEWLPDWQLPFGLSLPQALAGAVQWVLRDLAPALWLGVALPLVWLALTATVLGWRNFSASEVLAGKVPDRLSRFVPSSGLGRGLLQVAGTLGADLRDKYLPVLHSLSLIWRSGPRLLGVFIVGYALLQTLGYWLHAGLLFAVAPSDQIAFTRWLRLLELPGEFIVQTLTVALLVATFDRGLLGRLNPAATAPAPAPAAEWAAPNPGERVQV